MANSQSGDRYLFAGTNTNTRPFEVTEVNGQKRVVYQGNKDAQRVLIGRETTLQVSANGEDIFARDAYSETIYGDYLASRPGRAATRGMATACCMSVRTGPPARCRRASRSRTSGPTR